MTFNMGPAFWVIRTAGEAYCPIDSVSSHNWDDTLPAIFTLTGSPDVFDLDAAFGDPYYWVDGPNVALWFGTNSITIEVNDPSTNKFDSVRVWVLGGDWTIDLYDEDLTLVSGVFDYVDETDTDTIVGGDSDLAWHIANVAAYIGHGLTLGPHPPAGGTTLKNLKKVVIDFRGIGASDGGIDRIEFFCTNAATTDPELPTQVIYKQDGTGTRMHWNGTSSSAFTGF
jgi:hypothetical protein